MKPVLAKPEAQAVVDELVAIHRQGIGDQRSALVARAQPQDSPIHGLFEWDDRKAGTQFRLFQAGCLIASVRVQVRAALRPAAPPPRVAPRLVQAPRRPDVAPAPRQTPDTLVASWAS